VDQDVCGPERLRRVAPPLDMTRADSTVSTILGQAMHLNCSPRVQRASTVLIAGVGGAIGSELVGQLTQLGAHKVVCVDRDEYSLYRLQLGLTG
jgi:hypothetical protein